MKRICAVAVSLLFWASIGADSQPHRPRILGIARVRIFTTHLEAARAFYSQVLGPPQVCQGCDLTFSMKGYLQIFSNAPSHPAPSDLVDEIVFATDDINEMEKYLRARGVSPISGPDTASGYLAVPDPEGHHITFAQVPLRAPFALLPYPSQSSSMSLIHAGFVVHDRAAEDRFYKDILGFHVCWHGGMKDGEDNWVDMQVPDGSDWIEYMLGVSPNASHKTLGVMNHIALGVPDIHAAQQQLIKNGWKGTEEPKIGRDGKWQLNLYDPDETRVELMEFKPTKEPCCSPYTGPHPGPAQ
jgi:catechol 2,3-dioxygenase-like lactoylglutathione lyase family enzyme